MILENKMIELRLLMMGIPKSEINAMTFQELQILLHLISNMNRDKRGAEA